ncbi:MAG TPA: GNAT family N-acetyltransferase [Flavobacterium sp.]|jgi:ribosomal-protein-alanine N-acetyltransferase
MLTINFDPFPELRTGRLYLRRLHLDDVNQMFAMRSDPEVMKYVPRPLAKTRQDAIDHITVINSRIDSNEGINWAICKNDDPRMIGIIGHYRISPEHYRAEIGYMLLPEFHGNGYVSEAIAVVVEYGFEQMKLHSIEAIIAPENIASARVLEKNNFIKEAHLRENEYYEGRFLDTVIYSLLESDHRN